MRVIFTICSNNYLAQAKVLGISLKEHEPGSKFFIFLCDEKRPEIDYTSLADEIIPIAVIEPQINELALKYNIIELNTCIKPRAIEYLFHERNADKVLYLDPDIKVFAAIADLYDALATATIILTPHIYTPVPIDHKKPGENTFLNFGIYNLGFIGLSNREETHKFVSWWKEHTYKEGYIAPEKGIFVDQLPINHAPIFFRDVKILEDRGLNMAPWNLHERYLGVKDGKYVVNEMDALKFYHFSSFGVDAYELPLFHYDRFKLADRPDLQKIHEAYNEELKAAGHAFYQQFKSSYSIMRDAYLRKLKREKRSLKNRVKRLFAG